MIIWRKSFPLLWLIVSYTILKFTFVLRGVFVTGNTSTTSGLTVTLSRDQSSDCSIEAGALVLADQVWLGFSSLLIRYEVISAHSYFPGSGSAQIHYIWASWTRSVIICYGSGSFLFFRILCYQIDDIKYNPSFIPHPIFALYLPLWELRIDDTYSMCMCTLV